MSNIYDKAHELSRSLTDSEEFQNLKQLHTNVEEDEVAKRMLDNFRAMQLELQQKQMQGQQPSEEEITKAQKQFEMVQQHETISKLMEEEQRLSTIINDVNNIIMAPLEEIYGVPEE
ncbi:YlbF family regulator [Bacillus piscicola]|uniref:YlbF family regulator n=1 Tax=Bacillus piscicola TaxID=1632684 RepID=UPI001F08FA19|nr:YlbF family regulator [Bacillus piscicola]